MVIIARRESIRSIPSPIARPRTRSAPQVADSCATRAPYSTVDPDRVHHALSRRRSASRTAHHHRRTDLHRVLPARAVRRTAVRVVPMADGPVHGHADSSVQLGVAPQAEFHLNAAAAGLVLLMMTLVMNGIAIYIRYRFRKRIKW